MCQQGALLCHSVTPICGGSPLLASQPHRIENSGAMTLAVIIFVVSSFFFFIDCSGFILPLLSTPPHFNKPLGALEVTPVWRNRLFCSFSRLLMNHIPAESAQEESWCYISRQFPSLVTNTENLTQEKDRVLLPRCVAFTGLLGSE